MEKVKAKGYGELMIIPQDLSIVPASIIVPKIVTNF